MYVVQFGQLFVGSADSDGGQTFEADRLQRTVSTASMGEKWLGLI